MKESKTKKSGLTAEQKRTLKIMRLAAKLTLLEDRKLLEELAKR